MNRVITQISKSVKKKGRRNTKYLFLSNSAFASFFEKLNEKEVKYIIVGNMAIAFHGVIMTSGDLEVWIEATEENIEKVESITNADLSPGMAATEVTINSLGEQFKLKVYQKLDYFSSKKFNWCYVKSETSLALGVSIPILSLDDLIVEKTASSDPEDQEIVEALEKMSW